MERMRGRGGLYGVGVFLVRGGKLNDEKITEIKYDEGLRWPPFDILHATTDQTPRKVVLEIGVGVDLGTTNSAVAAMIGGAPGGARGPVMIPIRGDDDDVDDGGGSGGGGRAEGGRRRRRGRRGSAATTTTMMPSVGSIVPIAGEGDDDRDDGDDGDESRWRRWADTAIVAATTTTATTSTATTSFPPLLFWSSATAAPATGVGGGGDDDKGSGGGGDEYETLSATRARACPERQRASVPSREHHTILSAGGAVLSLLG